METEALQPLLRQALTHVATSMRQEVAQVAVCLQAGMGPQEAAQTLGLTWRAVSAHRDRLQTATVYALGADGYTDGEIVRYLGVPSAAIAADLRSTNGTTSR